MRLRDRKVALLLREVFDANDELGHVPSYLFDIYSVEDKTVAGRCDLRVGYNDKLYYAGNIGYTVFEQFRGRRFALSACFLLQKLALRHGMRELIVTCNPENAASKRICELFGAEYVKMVDLPEDHELFLLGERRKLVFIKRLY